MAENKPVGDSPRSKQESAAKDWHDLALGTWFFHDSPGSLERYSVQERTDGGCSIVCSTPYHYERAADNMKEIARLHNAAVDPAQTFEEWWESEPKTAILYEDVARAAFLAGQRSKETK